MTNLIADPCAAKFKVLKTSKDGKLSIMEFSEGHYAVRYFSAFGGWSTVADCETLTAAKSSFKGFGG